MAQYSDIYAFGDSLSDAGNDSIATAGQVPVAPPYYETSYGPLGTFTASVFSNGPVWVQDLAGALGLGTLRPSLYAGNDFAYGGAEADPTEVGFSGLAASVIALPSQLTQFDLALDGSSSGLYTLSIGTNDVQTILNTAGLSLADMAARIEGSVAAEISFVADLVDRGARSLLVLDVPDVGKLPVVTKHDDPAKIALATRLSSFYDVQLNAGLESLAQARGVGISILPLFSLLDQAVAEPAMFGLTNVTDTAWTGNQTDSNSGVVMPNPDSYLFWDEYHPTNHVQQLIASDAYSVLTTGQPLYTAPPVAMTDAATGQSSVQFGTVVTGTDTALQSQFLYPGFASVALRADTPDSFLKGGPGDDALQVTSGNNVLDGGGGSNFLVGAGGNDVFFVDGREGVPTWSTVVNFHAGDMATLFGFHAGLSTLAFTDADGAAGFQGLTLRSELNGAGTGVQATLTFAGIDQSHLSFTPGTIDPGTPTALDYLLVQWR